MVDSVIMGQPNTIDDLLAFLQSRNLGDIIKKGFEWTESEILDFKRVEAIDNRLYGNANQHYAKALSAFGSLKGGLIIWGVKCTKDELGRDVASEITGVDDVPGFLAYLENATSDSVEPKIKNIENSVMNNLDGKQIVISYVPESPFIHKSLIYGCQGYWTRSGSAFTKVEYSYLVKSKQMWQPNLKLAWEFVNCIENPWTRQNPNFDEVRIRIGVRNIGCSTNYVKLEIQNTGFGAYSFGVDDNRKTNLPKITIGSKDIYEGSKLIGNDDVVWIDTKMIRVEHTQAIALSDFQAEYTIRSNDDFVLRGLLIITKAQLDMMRRNQYCQSDTSR